MSANRAARNFYRSTLTSVVAFTALVTSAAVVGAQPADPPKDLPAARPKAPTAKQPKAEPTPAPTSAPTTNKDDSNDISIGEPEGWGSEPELALSLLPHFLKTVGWTHLDAKGGIVANVGKGVGVLYVAWVKAKKVAEDPAKEARATLDRMRAEKNSASEIASDIAEVSYVEKMYGEAIDVRHVWQHKGNETVTVSRALLWQGAAKTLRVVRAECAFSIEDKDTVTGMCTKALGSLRTRDIDEKTAVSLGNVIPPESTTSIAAGNSADKPVKKEGPSMTAAEPGTGVLYKNEKPRKKSRTIWFVILGVILVAFAFWSLQQNKREKAEAAAQKDSEDSEESEPKSEEEE